MRAAITRADGPTLAIADRPDPVPAGDELLVAVSRCGICGSDLHASRLAVPGTVLGHEMAGEVIGLGSEVGDRWRTGQRVAVFPLKGCGRCAACLAGRVSRCASVELLGFTRPGGFAELVAVGAREAVRLPDLLSDAEGALVEPLAVGLYALRQAAIDPGAPILLTGAGPIGLSVLVWARRLGVGPVVVSDPAEVRRDAAVRFGAAAVVDPTSEDLGTRLREELGGLPPVVVECSGRAGVLDQAMSVTADDGRVVVAGMCTEPDTVNHLSGMLKGLTIRYVLYYEHRDFDTTLRLLADDRFDASALVTDTVGLDELPERFEELKHPTTDVKVQIDPRR